MHLPIPVLPLADFFGFTLPQFGAIVIPIVGICFAGMVVFCGMYFQHRRRILWHETARIALEKGQPVPEASPDAPNSPWQSPAAAAPGARARVYLIGGLINLGIGAGIAIAFMNIAPVVSYLSAIPACIGVALLIGAAVESHVAKKSRD